ncbi:MAG: MarR family transcriptional regulator [Thermoleophilia bacterium]|nr:MarR family transcriptional regulator [Thermoleophilia bacterium]
MTENWTFLTNHARVLLMVAARPELRIRDIALETGVTERSVQRIVGDLEAAGYLRHERVGRRNRYVVDPQRPLRHPLNAADTVGDLMGALRSIGPAS